VITLELEEQRAASGARMMDAPRVTCEHCGWTYLGDRWELHLMLYAVEQHIYVNCPKRIPRPESEK
jgi:hypothetical protein